MSAAAGTSCSQDLRDLCLPLNLALWLRATEHVVSSTADLNPARPHCLGYLALELDREQTIGEIGARHLYMVGQLEAALEGAAGDTAMQHLALLLTAVCLGTAPPLASDDQHVLLSHHV